jgi:maltose O-acetyltransferase
VAGATLVPHGARPALLRLAGLRLGRGTELRTGLRLVRDAPVGFGEGCFVNHDCFIDARAPVTVGDDVLIGDHARLLTSTHEPGDAARRAGPPTGLPVVVGDGTWIGSGVTVLPGVTIGPGCVIAAGAVVAADCEPHGLYAGVPASRRRDLPR